MQVYAFLRNYNENLYQLWFTSKVLVSFLFPLSCTATGYKKKTRAHTLWNSVQLLRFFQIVFERSSGNVHGTYRGSDQLLVD